MTAVIATTRTTTRAADLAVYLAGYLRPFDWASAHCGHFIGGWVQATTGRDPLAGLPPADNALSWRRLLAAEGGFAAVVGARLQRPRIAPELAQAGDVVLLPGTLAGGTLGLCAGRHAVCVDEHGACVFVPMSEALHAWRLHAEMRDEVAA